MVAVQGPSGVEVGRAVRRSWQPYDPVDRLTADTTTGTNAHTFAYSYDSRGNILTNNETGTTITHTYDAASRLTTSIEGSDITTYTYDLNGNLTAAEKGASAGYMQYSPENQMSYYEDETADGTYYLYDPFARMKSSIYFAGLNHAFTWDDDLIIRQDDSTGLRRCFTQVDGQIVGEVTDLTGTPTTKSYLEDFLGSVTGEVSTSNVVSNSRRFTPYGRDWLGAASVAHSPGWVGGHGYHPTGLKWAGYSVFHRVVTPETGQWTTRDPIWPGQRPYGYVNGNPTTWIDPSGLQSDEFWFWECMRAKRNSKMHPQTACFECNGWAGTKVDCFSGPFLGPGTEVGQDIGDEGWHIPRGRLFPDVIRWYYANYCGKDNVKIGECRPPALNCIDGCCSDHDDCLTIPVHVPYTSRKGAACHCRLANCARDCLSGANPLTSEGQAVLQVYLAFAHICAITTWISIFTDRSPGSGGGRETTPVPPYPGQEPLPGTNVGSRTNPRYV